MPLSESSSAAVLELAEQFLERYRQGERPSLKEYIDRHPELVTQGFSIFTEVDVNCSQKKVLYVRADSSTCSAMPERRLTAKEI